MTSTEHQSAAGGPAPGGTSTPPEGASGGGPAPGGTSTPPEGASGGGPAPGGTSTQPEGTPRQPSPGPAATSPAGVTASQPPPGQGTVPPWRRSGFWRRPWAVAAAVLLVLLAILIAVELDDDTPPPRPIGSDHVATAPLADRSDVQFDLLSGAASVTVRAEDLGTDLYRIATPLDSGLLPRTVDHDGRVELQLVPSGPAGPSAVDIRLNTRVRWGLRLAGGATQETIDLSAGRVSGVDIVLGVSHIDLSLPRPQGTVPIRLTSGASEFTLHVPVGVPSRVTAGSGAGTLAVNGVERHGVAAGTQLASGGWDTATDRYDVQASAGVSVLTVDSR
jgi:hypothetical protein